MGCRGWKPQVSEKPVFKSTGEIDSCYVYLEGPRGILGRVSCHGDEARGKSSCAGGRVREQATRRSEGGLGDGLLLIFPMIAIRQL